jgi:predicted TIM-barrel fold metal-dependent hydrolase
MPYGNPVFWPVLEAVERHGLALCLHAGGMPGNPPTGTGWPSYYVEQVVGMAGAFQAQLISLLSEGVFARFPSLRVVLAEAGFAWLPPFLWRLDKEWKGLRRETPWNARSHTEVVAERVSLTVTPVDCPPERLEAVLGRLPGHMLLNSSDYPHVHAAPPEGLDAGRLDATAREVYRWQ